MQQPAPEQQPSVKNSVPDKHTEASQTRLSTTSTLRQIFTTYAQEYALVTTIPGEIMSTNMWIPRITERYTKAEVSDPDTMYFHQEISKSDATQF